MSSLQWPGPLHTSSRMQLCMEMFSFPETIAVCVPSRYFTHPCKGEMLPCPCFTGQGGREQASGRRSLSGFSPGVSQDRTFILSFCPLFSHNWTVQLPKAVHLAGTIPVSPLDTATDPTPSDEKHLRKKKKSTPL